MTYLATRRKMGAKLVKTTRAHRGLTISERLLLKLVVVARRRVSTFASKEKGSVTTVEALQLARDVVVIAAALCLIAASIVVVRLVRRVEAKLKRIEQALGIVTQAVEAANGFSPTPAKWLFRGIQMAYR